MVSSGWLRPKDQIVSTVVARMDHTSGRPASARPKNTRMMKISSMGAFQAVLTPSGA
jgi:hypothetical protein